MKTHAPTQFSSHVRADTRRVPGFGGPWMHCGASAASPDAAGASLDETVQPDLAIGAAAKRIAASKTLTVAVALGSPPDDFRNEKGEITGWEIDILHAASQSLGLTLDVRPTTFDSLIPGLQAKRFDAAVGQMGVTEVREKVVDMLGTLRSNELFAALSESSIAVKTLDDDLRSATGSLTTRGSRRVRGSPAATTRNAKRSANRRSTSSRSSDGAGAADSMMSKRSDLFCRSAPDRRQLFRHADTWQGRRWSAATPTLVISGSQCRRARTWLPRYRQRCEHLIDDGTYQKIVKKWGLEDGAHQKSTAQPHRDRNLTPLCVPAAPDAQAAQQIVNNCAIRAPEGGDRRGAADRRPGCLQRRNQPRVRLADRCAIRCSTRRVLTGLQRTLELTVAAMAAGLLLGTILALMRLLEKHPWAVDDKIGVYLVR